MFTNPVCGMMSKSLMMIKILRLLISLVFFLLIDAFLCRATHLPTGMNNATDNTLQTFVINFLGQLTSGVISCKRTLYPFSLNFEF